MTDAHTAPHLVPAPFPVPQDVPVVPMAELSGGKVRLWRPKRIVVTRAAQGSAVAERAVRVGGEMGAEVTMLTGNAVRGLKGDTEAETYRRAKSTLAIVNAPPSTLKLQPIPPSADFRVDLAVGCPAHCQYCYLAGSLSARR